MERPSRAGPGAPIVPAGELRESDAKRLIVGFTDAVAASPYNIAPERALDLNAKVFRGEPWGVVFADSSKFAMKALVDSREILVPYSGLMSLWAATRAVVLIGAEAMQATRRGEASLESRPDTPADRAARLIKAAKSFIRSPLAEWPCDLPTPNAQAIKESLDWYANNVFLGACGWILLHEVAHMHLSHTPDTSSDCLKEQEREADQWATNWILDHAPKDLRKEFRILAIAAAFTWIGLSDSIFRVNSMHPHAWDRFGHCTKHFKTDVLSPALEMSAYALKACFFPTQPIPEANTPEEAFFCVLIQATRLPR